MAAAAYGASVALITGGGTGVGAATAEALAQRGCRIAVNYRSSEESATAVVETCRSAGAEAFAIQGDVSQNADCVRMVAETVERWGKLNVLVCSAGTTQFSQLRDMDAQNAEDFQRVFATNALGAYQVARAAAPHLQAGAEGSVVMVSSIAALNGNGSSLAYIASKGALNSLTLALARILAPKVRVNAVLPGMIETDWFQGAMDDETLKSVREGFAAMSALETICSPKDIAEAVTFLALDAKRMTGQLMTVDSGFMLGRSARITK